MRTPAEIRWSFLSRLHEDANGLLMEPTPPKNVWPLIEAFGQILMGYEALVLATTSSSSSTYAFRDLPAQEREFYEVTKHALRVLNVLYNPVREG